MTENIFLLVLPSVLSVSASALCSSVREFWVALLLTCDSDGSYKKSKHSTKWLHQWPRTQTLPCVRALWVSSTPQTTSAVADMKISGNVMGTARLWSSVETSNAVSKH